MFLSATLIGAAFWLIARQAARDEKNPLEMLLALVAAVFGTSLLFSASDTLLGGVAGLLLAAGAGFVLTAGYVMRRKKPARPFFVIGLVALVLSALLFGGIRAWQLASMTDLLVELGPDDRIEELGTVLDRYGAYAEHAFPTVSLEESEDLAQVYIVHVRRFRLDDLSAELGLDTENVDHVELNRMVTLEPPIAVESSSDHPATSGEVRENDPLIGRQWALDAIRAHEAHALLQNLQPVRKAVVSIVDTGIDRRHEDISGTFADSPGSTDPHGHGSHCAGIAGGVTNNGLGIDSLNWESRFLDIRGYTALDAMGSGSIEMISQAVIDAAEDGSDVISMSLGDRSPIPPKTLSDAIAYARSRGAIVVTSAGNSSEDAADHMPSNIDGVFVVAALDQSMSKARFSNTNTSLARPIAAPGVDILSLRPGGGYVTMSGTSMATPMVAGLIGIIRSLDPDLSEAAIYDLIVETSRDVPDARLTGRSIDAGAAVSAVMNRSDS